MSLRFSEHGRRGDPGLKWKDQAAFAEALGLLSMGYVPDSWARFMPPSRLKPVSW